MTDDPRLLLLREVAIDVARREDAELKALGMNGIFDMPELAFAYAVGKEMAGRAQRAFPGQKASWQRELGNQRGGITDLVFGIGDSRPLAVEFKMAARREQYVADVQKLIPLAQDGYDCALCLVVDTFDKEGDGRIVEMRRALGAALQPVGALHTFETKSPRYVQAVHCIVGVWAVSPPRASHSA